MAIAGSFTFLSFFSSVMFRSERRLLPSTTCTGKMQNGSQQYCIESLSRKSGTPLCMFVYLYNACATLAIPSAGPHFSPRRVQIYFLIHHHVPQYIAALALNRSWTFRSLKVELDGRCLACVAYQRCTPLRVQTCVPASRGHILRYALCSKADVSS